MGGSRTDLTGKVCGRLTVLSYEMSKKYKAYWRCLCSCGKITVVRGDYLTEGDSKSCGCLHAENFHNKTHGMSYTPEYAVWESMKARCDNPEDRAYKNYGGRGVKYQHEWKEFEHFISDMGLRPSKDHSIERIDVDGNYSKENCHWIHGRSMQNFNQRKRKNNSSGRTGVRLARNKWEARICKDRKITILGFFNTFEEACSAREKAEIDMFGFSKQ